MTVFSKCFWRQLMLGCLVGSGVWSAAVAGADVKVTSTDKGVFPSGLTWERMRPAPFNFVAADPSTPVVKIDPKDQALAKSIWNDEIQKGLKKEPDAGFSMQVGTASYRGVPVAFSLLNLPLDFERCEPPLNGKNVVDMYSKCMARVSIGKANAHVVEFSGFCYLETLWATPQESKYRELNHNEYAFDAKEGVAYFRTLQYGKDVPACRRAVRIAQ